MKRAIVTGSEGFLGRHFRNVLADAGWGGLYLDIKNGSDALDFFRKPGRGQRGTWDLLIHCAAVVGGREVIEQHPAVQAVNVELDAAMFRWALDAKPRRVVYISSSAIYPVSLQRFPKDRYRPVPPRGLAEHDAIPGSVADPDAFYGWTKLNGERMAQLAADAGMPVTVVRPFSGYGGDQDPCYPFPSFVERALRRADPFPVWGTGLQVRDFIHVTDVVRATLTLAAEGVRGPVNIGTGRAVRMSDLAAMICAEAGHSPGRFAYLTERPSGVDYRVADTTLLSQFYRPAITLEQGIKLAVHDF